MRKVIIFLLLLSCLPLIACSDDPVLTLQTEMVALATWKVQTQNTIDYLVQDVSALKAQKAEVGYSKAEMDAMIQRMKDDQSWVKLPASAVAPTIPAPVAPYTPYSPVSSGAMTWGFGTYQINGATQNIYFQGGGQSWQIVATNTSQSSIYVIPQFTFRIYVNPQTNVYTSNGASLSWNNAQMGTTFNQNGVPCDSGKMPSGISVTPMGLNSLALDISPNVSNTNEASPQNMTNAYMGSATSQLTITPICGGANGLGAVLLAPNQTMAWNLTTTINTHQTSTGNGYTNYSSGPWALGVGFLTNVYK